MKTRPFGWILTSTAIFFATATQDRKQIVDEMHQYYKSQFEDLTLAKQGTFGTSRIESSKIDGHHREGGDPGYRSHDWVTVVTIYGNKGAALDPKTLESRYHRTANGNAASPPIKRLDETRFLAEAISKFKNIKVNSHSTTLDGAYYEARPIRLTKSECLSCHAGMRKNEAVAIMLYTVLEKVKQ